MPVRFWNLFIPFVFGTCLCNLIIIIMKEWNTHFISRLTVFNIIKHSVCVYTFLNLFNWTISIGLPKIPIKKMNVFIAYSLHSNCICFYFNVVLHSSGTYEACLSKLNKYLIFLEPVRLQQILNFVVDCLCIQRVIWLLISLNTAVSQQWTV